MIIAGVFAMIIGAQGIDLSDKYIHIIERRAHESVSIYRPWGQSDMNAA